jgi:hypothetical protein
MPIVIDIYESNSSKNENNAKKRKDHNWFIHGSGGGWRFPSNWNTTQASASTVILEQARCTYCFKHFIVSGGTRV